jgi:hypothetical protein
MKSLKHPCSNTRTKAGQDFLDNLDKLLTGNSTFGASSSSNILNNIQEQLDVMVTAQNEEPATISDDELSGCSEDGQSSLMISDSGTSD